MLFSVRWRSPVKEAGGCLTNVTDAFLYRFILYFFVQKFAWNLNHVFFFTQLLSTASRGQEISIIHEDGLFLHMKLLLDTNWSFYFVFTTSIFISPSNLNICMFCDVQFAIKCFKPIFFFFGHNFVLSVNTLSAVLHYAPADAAANPVTHPAEMQQQGNDLCAAWWSSCSRVAMRKCLIIPVVLVSWD